ncbi:glycosyl transferase [Paractinoplanes abujensis]|uniref:Glycosyltransferase involved in cell wall biosynthesis n=1 Tax=Paractinoplanes abujensis TaxID=882441 RepID=A0A7W7CP73_9ACTN|nr:glycosyltransferase family 4 protein [Actinoplanes abujensis]MBB4690740.1 glycosyltransferase involved in cell wall biosynthesis [Actinoplanes abujensis]GID17847.1 glycosyl transferase [Actinoplanes abujensis]
MTLWAVLPGGVDDPAAPSGGNRYDRAVLSLLPDVHEIAIVGDWPAPGTAARKALQTALTDIPDMSDVLIDGLVGCGVPEILEPHAARLRLIMLVHLPLSDETGLDPATADELRAREKRAVHLATTVVATSQSAADRVRTMHDLVRVEVARPGVDPAPPAEPDPTGRRLLCVAAVTPRKGQDLLVGALQNDLAGLDWQCTLAGALIKPVPYEDSRLRFVGALHGAALDAAYGEADLLVLPSRAETYGMVVTEALARGVPVLATAVGGVPEALGTAPDGTRPGLLIPPDDRPALTAALRSWLTDGALRYRLRAAARARRETLPTWSATASALSAICEGDPR